MTIELVPVEGLPEIAPGDDLAAILVGALGPLGPREGDVVAVTQKIVSKAEGRVVAEGGEGRSAWIERETRRIVARRGELVIVETRHGLVCANAGVDASNVAEGWLTLLPEDPDASAERLRVALREAFDAAIGVVITDTFGRPWREGLVNVAIGCAGLPALVDLRGSSDHHGRELETTVIALADEVAAASGLVMGKADRVPAAIVRGLGVGIDAAAPGASVLVRRPEDDLFREAPLWSIRSASPSTAFERGGAIPREALEEAIAAAVASDGPTFVVATSDLARRRLAAAVAGLDPTADAILRDAGALVVPFVDLEEITDRDAVMLAAGAAIDRLALALHAQALAWAWTDASRQRSGAVRWALGVEENWAALGIVAVGEPSAGAASSRPPLDLSALRFL